MQRTYSRSFVVNCAIGVEALLLLVATIWVHLAHIDLLPMLVLKDATPILIGAALGVIMSLSSLVIAKVARKYKDRLPFLSGFDEIVSTMLQPLFKGMTPLDIFLIAFSSGFCEEVFFRGVLQTQFGLIPASIIFGLVHCSGWQYIIYVIWAMLAGLLFGVLLQVSGGLWLPITMHVVNNLVSITMIRYQIGYTPDSSSDSDPE